MTREKATMIDPHGFFVRRSEAACGGYIFAEVRLAPKVHGRGRGSARRLVVTQLSHPTIACDLSALTAEERVSRARLAARIRSLRLNWSNSRTVMRSGSRASPKWPVMPSNGFFSRAAVVPFFEWSSASKRSAGRSGFAWEDPPE